MWRKLAIFVLQYKRGLLLCLLISTVMMGFLATKVKLSYEFAKAIPANHPVYKDYLSFKEKFGDDGNTVVIGVQSNTIFELPVFLQYRLLHQRLKQVADVEDVMSVPFAVNLYKDSLSEKLVAKRIFSDSINSQAALDSAKAVFFNLPFYQSLLYNPQTHAYLMGVRINPDS
ncbi:MAG TPA: RND transporter, partial [Ferruginibacter sp.]|nr:RND transporter [Ferruginibacter sp.]